MHYSNCVTCGWPAFGTDEYDATVHFQYNCLFQDLSVYFLPAEVRGTALTGNHGKYVALACCVYYYRSTYVSLFLCLTLRRVHTHTETV